MAGSKFIPDFKMNNAIRINWEKYLLKKNYTFLEIKTNGNTLSCKGYCQPSDYSIQYVYKLIYSPDESPVVYTINPKITYNEEIHMYPQDDRLCLHYPKDYSWTSASHLYNTIIPWTHEWFLYYELFQISGKWMHPSVSHAGTKNLL